ncbi:MBL fold metallo-hydrolase [Salipaludibacillus aurantiacus]|uniref:Hydroxyacylglutathione hydrolase n=1 Tax=Salipaludibacillus aurantiacus TaxID=1601833 RepID=A0A1H9X6Q9_9BACI|nr:MBL fold metallo-hydrolase [Salipaludibacillus aurantiacus]SES41557.1 hydroxyacylglutathione hydrolase [Salipaludibacillus aurantiacus]
MLLKYFYDDALAQASYMVGCQKTGEAAIIDPSRNIDTYFDTAEKEGMTITKVLETHIHADFVSGAREMAERSSATIYYSLEGEGDESGEYKFDSSLPQQGVRDGDQIKLGNVTFDVWHTPGHTPEHITFLLTDGAASGEPLGMFTGDFIFVGDVGRPDLLEKAAGVKDSAKKGAEQMFHSLEKAKEMDPTLQIWPGHGAGSACGKSLGSIPTTTLGYELKTNPALQYSDEKNFTDFLLDEQPVPPAYFAVMKKVNKEGAPLLRDQKTPLRYGSNVKKMDNILEADVTLVDTRSREAYSQSHIPGSINIPYDSSFTNWAGSLISYDKPVYFIASSYTFTEIIEAMNAIGLDKTAGFFTPAIVESFEEEHGTGQYEVISPEDAYEKQNNNELQILDIREDHEYEAEHVENARHMVINYLPEKGDDLPDKTLALYCGSGARSAIATSILKSKGFDVKNIKGGFMRWKKENLPTASE